MEQGEENLDLVISEGRAAEGPAFGEFGFFLFLVDEPFNSILVRLKVIKPSFFNAGTKEIVVAYRKDSPLTDRK